MKYRIKEYFENGNFFRCIGEDGRYYNLDLFTDSSFSGFGNLGKHKVETYKKFIGREIEVENTFPYISFAQNVKLLKLK